MLEDPEKKKKFLEETILLQSENLALSKDEKDELINATRFLEGKITINPSELKSEKFTAFKNALDNMFKSEFYLKKKNKIVKTKNGR